MTVLAGWRGIPFRARDLRASVRGVPSSDDVILARIRSIAAGRVTTYGDVSPGAPRRAGAALAACDDPSVPWQRVVRADGSLAKGERQRRLLEAEQVPFRGERVDMRAAWVPPRG
jgi:methylated-DNA-protein-cysteine methyltransferase-like protein